jgi:hypothetical protein
MGLRCQSQYGDRLLRLRAKAFKLRRKLGDHGGVFTEFPGRPKRAHFATYDRRMKELFRIELEAA